MAELTRRYTFTAETAGAVADITRAYERELAAFRERVEALDAENARLRALYENAVGNRERFGWTINHLLECEEALRTVEERVEALEAQRDEALKALGSQKLTPWESCAEARRILSGERERVSDE